MKRDIVMIIDTNVKRGCWKLGEVVNTYVGDDGLVRVVDVKMGDGQVLRRPVVKLIILLKNNERVD